MNPFLFERDKSVIVLYVNSKEYLKFIKHYVTWGKDKTFTIRLKNKISAYSDSFLKGFAKGLMDTDGFVESHGIGCACISERLIKNLSIIFTKFRLLNKISIINRKNGWRTLYKVRVRVSSLQSYKEL